MKTTYVFLADAFGYGPVVTACNLADKLKKSKECKLIFIGPMFCTDMAMKYEVFDEIIVCKSYNPEDIEKHIELLKSATGVIATETTDILIYLINKYKMSNLYLVDNLFWMWDFIEEELKQLKRYYISNVIDCSENIRRIGEGFKNLMVVGSTTALSNFVNCEKNNNIMISFGGAESYMLSKEDINDFYLKLLNIILNQKEIRKFKKIFVTGGTELISFLSNKIKDKDIHFEAMSNKKYIEILKTCSHTILSPGLANFNKVVCTNLEVLFLLPINYSQYLQREHYKHLGLGFYFQEFNENVIIEKYLEEEIGVKEVVTYIKKYINENNFIGFEKVLYNFFTDEKNNTLNRKSFYDKFPQDGLQTIVDDIIGK